jgi:hypothetical protein
MRFARRGECDVVTRIAGPLHHYLGLRLIQDQGTGPIDPTVEDLSPPAGSRPLPLQPTVVDLVTTVLEGLKAANDRLGTRYTAEKIIFCSSDQYRKETYKLLTEALVEHVSQKENHLPQEAAADAKG